MLISKTFLMDNMILWLKDVCCLLSTIFVCDFGLLLVTLRKLPLQYGEISSSEMVVTFACVFDCSSVYLPYGSCKQGWDLWLRTRSVPSHFCAMLLLDLLLNCSNCLYLGTLFPLTACTEDCTSLSCDVYCGED